MKAQRPRQGRMPTRLQYHLGGPGRGTLHQVPIAAAHPQHHVHQQPHGTRAPGQGKPRLPLAHPRRSLRRQPAVVTQYPRLLLHRRLHRHHHRHHRHRHHHRRRHHPSRRSPGTKKPRPARRKAAWGVSAQPNMTRRDHHHRNPGQTLASTAHPERASWASWAVSRGRTRRVAARTAEQDPHQRLGDQRGYRNKLRPAGVVGSRTPLRRQKSKPRMTGRRGDGQSWPRSWRGRLPLDRPRRSVDSETSVVKLFTDTDVHHKEGLERSRWNCYLQASHSNKDISKKIAISMPSFMV